MVSRPTVLHLCGPFVEASQPWLFDLISVPGAFDPAVLCETRLRADVYPFDDVRAVLPAGHRFDLDWFIRQLNVWTPLRLAPHNVWRKALDRAEIHADVIHAHFGHCGWMATDAGLAPVVVSFYGFDAHARHALRHWGPRYPEMFARGASFVAEGPAMAAKLVALGAPIDRVRVLPLTADVSGLQWREPRVDGVVHVLMAGRLVEKKGFALGVEAFARLAAADALLTIVGSGPELGSLQRLVAKREVANRVEFIPFVERTEYRKLLAAADIVLQPSVTASNGDSEGGAPTVLLDAQAVGTIIVASDHADIPFVVDPAAAYLSREGDVEDLAAALCRAVDSRGEWAARAAAGRRHVEAQHAPAIVAGRRDAIYVEVVGRPGE